MEIRILCENLATDMCWHAEWGFSALISHRGHQVLFDTGFSNVWQTNAAQAGVDLDAVDVIALSHFHRDHTRGLLYHQFKTRKRMVLHPRVLDAVLPTNDAQIRKDYGKIHDALRNDFDLETATDPVEMTPGAWFLGEVPRVTSFEKGAFFDDPMPDDTVLAIATDKGAVVVSGCSHAGICNICEYAKVVTGQPLYAVIGGFHLMADEDPPVEETIAWFQRENVPILHPMHCIDFDIQARMQTALGYQRMGAGDLIQL